VFGRLRPFAMLLYRLVLFFELMGVRLIDNFHPLDKTDISDLTLIIKTFERPYAVSRLVKSIQRRYPQADIMVIDDSREPISIAGVTMLKLPYDTGISFGRNAALDRCETEFFLLLDDDFVFSHRQCLSSLCQYMRTNENIDIAGGRCIDLPLWTVHNFHDLKLSEKAEPKIPLGTKVADRVVVDRVQNYFIGRTEAVRKVKWSPALKVLEHTEFFSRAKGKLLTVYDPSMLILHVKWPFDLHYMRKRYRA
jgi:hypothetical protein